MTNHISEGQNKRVSRIRTRVIRFSIYLLAFFLLCLSLWINRYFGRPNLEQILYHFSFGSEGLLDTDRVLMYRFFKWCIVPPLLFAALAMKAENSRYFTQLGQGEQRFKTVGKLALRGAPVLLLGIVAANWMHQVSAIAYFTSNFGPDYFSPNYVSPVKVELRAKKPKNLVLIYVESLEASYSNANLFGADLLSELNQLGGVSFNKYRQAPGTGWTIAGIVSTQCGLPLKSVTIYDGNQQGEVFRSFLPNAICLGDILDGLGYQNVFMGGASLSFAGKGKFLQDHHYNAMYGREEWLAQGVDPDEMNGWGLYDDDLLDRARSKLQELHASNRPFNLTMLTVDTHFPNGHLSKTCARRGSQGFGDIVKCTAEQVADFVKFIKDNGYLADTNVIVLGDHLTMRNSLSEKLSTVPERYIFNSFISANPPKKNRDNILHFDLFPTILEFMGIEVAGNRLGLGYSAFYKSDEWPSPDRLQEMQNALLNRSDAYLDLWTRREAH